MVVKLEYNLKFSGFFRLFSFHSRIKYNFKHSFLIKKELKNFPMGFFMLHFLEYSSVKGKDYMSNTNPLEEFFLYLQKVNILLILNSNFN